MDYSMLKKKYIGLDILRIVSALVICMFHTTIHLGCSYGILQGISKMGAVFMTAFFMLSGCSLFVNWSGINLNDISSIKHFYKRRLSGIIPMYWMACILYIIFTLPMKEDSLLEIAILAPIEVVGLQSVFSSLFGFSHNGGTWFISCILICYFVYPFFQEIVKNVSLKIRIWMLSCCAFFLLYSPLIVHVCKIQSTYSNPFFRLLEFIIGMILASMKLDFKDNKFINKFICNWFTILIVNVLMIIVVTLVVSLDFAVGNYMLYSWICLPCFIIILYGLLGIESKVLNKSRALAVMSGASYVFFLAQLYSNKISKMIISVWGIESNLMKMFIGWSVCILITVGLRLIEIGLRKWLTKLAVRS